ncbi:MAG: DUF1588 domain-containing protein [Myxococcota bacterium]
MRLASACALLLPFGCYAGHQGSASGGGDGDASADDGGSGDDGGTADDGPAPTLECEAIGTQPLRRLSSEQYRQVLTELLPGAFGTAALAASTFPATAIDSGFSTYATANTVSTNESIAIEDNAEAIAAVFAGDIDTYAPELVPCLSAGFGDDDIDACIDGFIADFGRRAFRRPLTEGESTVIGQLYAGIAAEDGARAGLTAVVQYFVQAPALLYATEQSDDGDSYTVLSPDELAVRLGLLFNNGAPDAELLAAVDEGDLRTREDVEREARRMVGLPAAQRAFATFHHEWMSGFELESAQREHPLMTPEAEEALATELRAFATWFLTETDGSFETLMTTEAFPVDTQLAPIYGAGGGGARRGLLTTAAAMASHAYDDRTSLVERGAFIRNHVLCNPTPAFPGDIDIEGTLGGSADLPTARGRLEPLMVDAACSGCHSGINPLGFPFEAYDWVGAYRTTENDAPIDVSTDIDIGSLSGSFADAGELIAGIAGTDEARDCYATHWFRYALGRPETPDDACALGEIKADFAEAEGDVRELLVAIATSDAFMFRKSGGGQ